MGYLVLAVIAASLFYPALFIGQAHAQSSGQLFTVDLLCPIGNPARQQWCSIIQKSLQQVGINAQLTYAPFSTLIAHLLGPQSTWNESFSQGGYDIAFVGLYNSNPLINPAR
jgi:ABC-type transport system substrate-binding protein